jgi:hypothetical protein
MFERFITCAATEDAGREDPAAIRGRLRGVFTPGFDRRATILGLLIGGVLRKALGNGCNAIVYGSAYGETRALGDFLEGFSHPSPTLFQISVHPSAVQQLMIDRRQPVREFIPVAGGPHLAARILAAALLSPCDPVILCGGEEHGGWLADHGVASERSFAFALTLGKDRDHSAQGRLRLRPRDRIREGRTANEPEELSFPAWFELLHARRNHSGPLSPEWCLELEWL